MRNSRTATLALLVATTAAACATEPAQGDRAPAYEVDSTECGPDGAGAGRADGTLANRSAVPHSYHLRLRFVEPTGAYVETPVAFGNIAPDEAVNWTARAGAPWVPGSSCEIVEVVEQGMF